MDDFKLTVENKAQKRLDKLLKHFFDDTKEVFLSENLLKIM